MEVTEVPRKRAEQIVRDLVKAGEVGAHEAQERVEELLDRSRKTTEAFADRVRVEVQRQMEALGLVQAPPAPAKKAVKKAVKTATKKSAPATKKAVPTKKAATAKKTAGS
jgi:polyhydroxyalkanoate synthesis regulator phasin